MNDYNKAIELNPAGADEYYNRGNLYKASGNLEQAINDYSKAIELEPKDAEAYYNRGVVYQKLGNNDMFIQNLKMSAKLGDEKARDDLRSKGIEWH